MTSKFCLVFLTLLLVFTLASSRGSLERDNPQHRGWSNNLDNKFGGEKWYDNYARPIVHGAYHAGRAAGSLNGAEWARAKDQFSAVGEGQPRSEYLKAYRDEN